MTDAERRLKRVRDLLESDPAARIAVDRAKKLAGVEADREDLLGALSIAVFQELVAEAPL